MGFRGYCVASEFVMVLVQGVALGCSQVAFKFVFGFVVLYYCVGFSPLRRSL